MGLRSLRSFLRRHHRVLLDTSIFIYQLEENERYIGFSAEVFSQIEAGLCKATTSTITMTELLVQPYRNGNMQLIDSYFALLTTHPNLDWIAPDLAIADTAARLRADHRMQTPDALQAATAIEAKVTGLITNDPIFKRVEGIEVFVFEEFV